MPYLEDPDEPIDSGWWAAQEEADARHEAEHGPAVAQRPKSRGWEPEWVRNRKRLFPRPEEMDDLHPVDIQEARFGIREESQW